MRDFEQDRRQELVRQRELLLASIGALPQKHGPAPLQLPDRRREKAKNAGIPALVGVAGQR